MNNQSLILWAVGLFAVLLVAAAAADQYLLEKHPPTEVGGLFWLVDSALNRVQDMEATLQVTTEEPESYLVRMSIKYLKGPPPVFSMRYVASQDSPGNRFITETGGETFSIVNDQLSQYLPSANILVSKRWPGFPLVALGLGFFDLSQLQSDWEAGKVDILVQQNVPGIPRIAFTSSIRVEDSFSLLASLESPFENAHRLCSALTSCVDSDSRLALVSSTLAEAPEFDDTADIQTSYVLEVRDSASEELERMIWIDRDTYLVQKVVLFTEGKRVSTMLVQLMTIDQGLTEADVLPSTPPGVENIRG